MPRTPKTEPWRWTALLALPDAVTGLALVSGLAALYVGLVWQRFGAAFALLFLSAVADISDGAVARATGRARPFGGHFDCMVDTIVFLPIASALAYALGMKILVLHLAFNACGALRHARLLAHPKIKRLGIPSTVSGFAFPIAYALHVPLGVPAETLFVIVMALLSIYVNLYLPVRSCHRWCAPFDGILRGETYVAGDERSLGLRSLARSPPVFPLNERLVQELENAAVELTLVAVGGIAATNIASARPACARGPVRYLRGQELGAFHLGSSIVILLPARLAPRPLRPGQGVRMGEPLLLCPGEQSPA